MRNRIMDKIHVPVMLNECLDGLVLRSDAVFVDCTAGFGGHSTAILERSDTSTKLVCVDKDADALNYLKDYLKPFGERVTLVKNDFVNTDEILSCVGYKSGEIDGVLMDLGVSSFQLDHFERGFSYRANDAKLDMRMDRDQYLTAFNVVNEYGEGELYRIIREYGEERYAGRIASNIVKFRDKCTISTCGQLNEIIDRSIPFSSKKTGGHPSKRTFQAIRIEVNGELRNLRNSVEKWVRALKKGGRIAVLTFHSLEDRIVKQTFAEMEKSCVCDRRAPVCVCGKVKEVNIINKKPIVASDGECANNPRSQSAKLRIAERV